MIDVARADNVFDDDEFDTVLRLVERHYQLTADEAAELVNVADAEADDLVSVYDFTSVLHERLGDEDKEQVVSLLWQVAYADGRLDKYEDALVRKIGDLLYVSRGAAMRLKHEADSRTS